jgi:hypothetical protein
VCYDDDSDTTVIEIRFFFEQLQEMIIKNPWIVSASNGWLDFV